MSLSTMLCRCHVVFHSYTKILSSSIDFQRSVGLCTAMWTRQVLTMCVARRNILSTRYYDIASLFFATFVSDADTKLYLSLVTSNALIWKHILLLFRLREVTQVPHDATSWKSHCNWSVNWLFIHTGIGGCGACGHIVTFDSCNFRFQFRLIMVVYPPASEATSRKPRPAGATLTAFAETGLVMVIMKPILYPYFCTWVA